MTKRLKSLMCAALLGLLLWNCFLSAAPPADPMPPAAITVLTQFDKEVTTARTKALTSLERVLKDTTKKGDFAGAVAVKEAIDQLRSNAKAQSHKGRAANHGTASALTGEWIEGTRTVTLSPDGSALASGTKGQWSFDGAHVVINWSDGIAYRLRVDSNSLTGTALRNGVAYSDVQLTRPK